MKIRCLNHSEYEDYNNIAKKHGTLFNSLDWLLNFGQSVKILGLYDDGGELFGGISFFQQNYYGFKVFRNVPFTPTCGPVVVLKAQHPVAVLETRRKVLNTIVDYFKKENPAIIRLSLEKDIVDTLPFFWDGYKVIPAYTYQLNLLDSIDKIMVGMSSERRKNIKKANRDGLVVRFTTDLNIVKELCLKTFSRQDIFIDQKLLDSILFKYANDLNSYAYTTYRAGGAPIATCFVVHDLNTAYYLIGGYSTDSGHHGAGALAMYEAIRHAIDIGIKVFDFEGSIIPSIERYFRGFGGVIKPYYTVNKAWLPLEMGLKIIKRNVF